MIDDNTPQATPPSRLRGFLDHDITLADALARDPDADVASLDLRDVSAPYGGFDLPAIRAVGYGHFLFTADASFIEDPEEAWEHIIDTCLMVVQLCEYWPILDLSPSLPLAGRAKTTLDGSITVGISVRGSHFLNSERLGQLRSFGVVRLAPVSQSVLGWADSMDDAPWRGGLSASGREGVSTANDLGMRLDLRGLSAGACEEILPLVRRAPVLSAPQGSDDLVVRRVLEAGGSLLIRPAADVHTGARQILRLLETIPASKIGIASGIGDPTLSEPRLPDPSALLDLFEELRALGVPELDLHALATGGLRR